MNTTPNRCLGLLALGLILYSCSTGMETGGWYEVSGDQQEGIFIPDQQARGTCSGTFYVDQGKRYAEKLAVEVKAGLGKTKMVFPDGQEQVIRFKAYEAPAYEELPEVRLYTQPQYEVQESLDQPVGKARGFWSSYPCKHGESFGVTFGRKTAELLSMKDQVDVSVDIYTPIGDEEQGLRPLILFIHGGAFFNGDKHDPAFVAWCRHFASLGYVAASVNYRLGFRPTRSEIQRAGYRAVQDANAALRYLVNRREELHIDPDLVFVAGTSSGGITALNVSYMMAKDRPAATRSGKQGDDGPIDALNPDCQAHFGIRAVGNLWGAVNDLGILQNQRIPVISFHGENDPIVPYTCGYPFQNLLGSLNVGHLLFDQMYGSYEIDRQLKQQGVHTELYPYPTDKHGMHMDDDGSLNQLFYTIEEKLTTFFSSEMESEPVCLTQDPADPQLLHINPAHIRHGYWSLQGGVFRSTASDQARILLFPDRTDASVSVSGDYLSGMTFHETLSL